MRPLLKRVMPISLLLLAGLWVVGCVRFSGGTWMIRSAPTPEAWPELTPVGEVRVKQVPAYRAAFVTAPDVGGRGMRPMFMTLFDHIKDNEIAMTAPVEMGYEPGAGSPSMASMAFLYRTPRQGAAGPDETVSVRDVPSQTVASVGVRGDYTPDRFARGLAIVEAWLAANAERWVPAGGPRYLGYNGPFVPTFMRYGEVQVPVRSSDSASEGP